MFYDRYIEACDKIGIAPSRVLRELNISTSKLDFWKNGGTPKDDVVERIADFLEVDESDFYDYPETRSWDAVKQTKSKSLTDDEQELLDEYRKRTRAEQLKVKLYILSLDDD